MLRLKLPGSTTGALPGKLIESRSMEKLQPPTNTTPHEQEHKLWELEYKPHNKPYIAENIPCELDCGPVSHHIFCRDIRFKVGDCVKNFSMDIVAYELTI